MNQSSINTNHTVIPIDEKLGDRTVILANGKFPKHEIPKSILRKAREIICCDGAMRNLENTNIIPTTVIGDFDSLQPLEYWKNLYPKTQFLHIPCQYSTDLTKAVEFCRQQKSKEVSILGATGLREDHTFSNISHLHEYIKIFPNINMITDTGVFYPITQTTTFHAKKGTQVSVFSFDKETTITYHGLKYPIHNKSLNLWEGALNESEKEQFIIQFSKGTLLVFITFEIKNTTHYE